MEGRVNTFSLCFHEHQTNSTRTITFESEDAHEAFSIMEREDIRGPAEIWLGGTSLGTITHTPEGGWILKGRDHMAMTA